MAKVVINKDKCKGCFLCVSFCPKGLLRQSSGLNKKGCRYVETKESSECSGCCRCAVICPDCCIEIYNEKP